MLTASVVEQDATPIGSKPNVHGPDCKHLTIGTVPALCDHVQVWRYSHCFSHSACMHVKTFINAISLQKLTFIQSSIRPAMTYALPICPYTTKDVQLQDNKMAAVAKKAIGISRCMPNGMV